MGVDCLGAACCFGGLVYEWDRQRQAVDRQRAPWQPAARPALPPATEAVPVQQLHDHVEQVMRRTAEKLKTKPKDIDDPQMVTHMLAAVADLCGAVAGFEDKPGTTTESLLNMMAGAEDVSCELSLSGPPQGYDDTVLQNGSQQQQRFANDCRERIARTLGVPESRVVVQDIRRGSVIVHYVVTDLVKKEKEDLKNMLKLAPAKFEKEFNTYKSMKVHAAAFVLNINPNDIDPKGNKTFEVKDDEFFMVGPPGKQEKYVQPEGWTRVGLKVLKATDPPQEQTWLRPFGHDENWYRCFHGAGTTAANREGLQDRKSMQTTAKGITEEGIRAAACAVHGPGAYVSYDVNYAELYAGKFQVHMRDGMKEFKLAFQVAVKPGAFSKHMETWGGKVLHSGPGAGQSCHAYYQQETVEWVVENPSLEKLIPYGILFKEVVGKKK